MGRACDDAGEPHGGGRGAFLRLLDGMAHTGRPYGRRPLESAGAGRTSLRGDDRNPQPRQRYADAAVRASERVTCNLQNLRSMLEYDDENLMRLFEAIGEEGRRKALKSALTRAAGKLRRAAVKNLRNSGLHGVASEIEKGVRRSVYKGELGFRVTISPRKRDELDRLRQVSKEEKKLRKRRVIAFFAEGGTGERMTKDKTKFWVRKRRGHRTGSMPAFPFMEKTKTDAAPQIEQELKEEIVKSIKRIAKKYGCT